MTVRTGTNSSYRFALKATRFGTAIQQFLAAGGKIDIAKTCGHEPVPFDPRDSFSCRNASRNFFANRSLNRRKRCENIRDRGTLFCHARIV